MANEQGSVSIDQMRFFYLKNPAFRVVHVDGAVGGVTPRGRIPMAVYSERPAIPQSSVHSVVGGVHQHGTGKLGCVEPAILRRARSVLVGRHPIRVIDIRDHAAPEICRIVGHG